MQTASPTSEAVGTIFNVIQAEKPAFWNPTSPTVHENFAHIYRDPTGELFSKGPSF